MIYFYRTISNSLTIENGTAKSNGLTNEFKFETDVEKPCMQISGFEDIINNSPPIYDKSKYI